MAERRKGSSMAVWAKRAAITLTLAAVAATASGCARVRNHQGYVADTTLVQSIQPGVDNRDSVMKTLGRPSFEAEFDKNAWYYVSRETRQFGFNRPKRSDEHTSELQSLMRISYAVFCLKKKNHHQLKTLCK